MKTPNYQQLEQWVTEHPEELQLRPGHYLVVALPHGLVTSGETSTQLLNNLEQLAHSNIFSSEKLQQPCFILQTLVGTDRGQA